MDKENIPEKVHVAMKPKSNYRQDEETWVSYVQAIKSCGEANVVKVREGSRSAPIIRLDNGLEYDSETGLQINSEMTYIVELAKKE